MSHEHSPTALDTIEGFEILQVLDPKGPIYQARDLTSGALVTLTRLPILSGRAWSAFLRATEPLTSLVSTQIAKLLGFVAQEEHWFAIEEFLAGEDLVNYVRRRSPDDAALFGLFQQVAQALSLLHHLGWPHGQLTPDRIRCEIGLNEKVRVVVVSPRLVHPQWLISAKGSDGAGTNDHYRSAPNLTFSKSDFADDWYSFAKCIQLALESTPRADSAPSSERIILTRLSGDLLISGINAPSFRDITNRLRCPAFLPGIGPTLFDRPELLAQLREMFSRARSGKVAVVTLEGAVGLGKTTLLKVFLEECRARGSIVLSALCNELPEHPHGAFSIIIDELCALLRAMSPHDLRRVLAPDVAILARLFPAVADLITPRFVSPENADVEPLEQRSRALAALRRLLTTLGSTLPVVIAFDDAHHLDAATTLLLEQLLDEACPAILFIFAGDQTSTTKSLEVIHRFMSRQSREGNFRAIEVPRLEDEESLRWVTKWCGAPEKRNSEATARILRLARGEPLLLVEFVRCQYSSGSEEPVSYDEAILLRLRHLSVLASRVLEVLAVARHPLRIGDLARAWPDAEVGSAVAEAHEQGFVRARGRRADDKIEFTHSEVRRVVLARLSAAQQCELHSLLAKSLDVATIPAMVMAFHYEGAGNVEKAAHFYEVAADNAVNVCADDMAARGYRKALELTPDLDEQKSTTLWERLADALWFSGQTIAAGDACLTLARRTTGRRSAHFQEKAAHAYLRGGYVDAAVAGLRQVLEQAGVPFPESRAGVLLRLGWRKTMQSLSPELPTFTPEKRMDEDLVHRIDLSWAMIGGLGNLDPLLGAYYQQEHLKLALSSGDPLRAARALAAEAAFIAAEGAQNTPTVMGLLDRARQLVEAHEAPAYWHGILSMLRGESAFFRGDFRVAGEALAHAEMVFSEQCVGVVWELLATQFYQLYALFFLGRFRELRMKEARARRFARSRGDVHALSMLRSIRVSIALADGDPNRAIEELTIADQKWAVPGLHLHHVIDTRLRSEIDLYLGRAEAADARAQSELRPLLSSTLNQIQFVRIEAIHLQARCALAAMRPDAKDQKRRKIVERAISDLQDEPCAWARALATLLEAGLAARARDKAAAARKLDVATKQFEALGMSIHEAVARRRRSEIDLAPGSAVPLAVIDRFLIEHHGVRSPAQVAAMLAPGF